MSLGSVSANDKFLLIMKLFMLAKYPVVDCFQYYNIVAQTCCLIDSLERHLGELFSC